MRAYESNKLLPPRKRTGLTGLKKIETGLLTRGLAPLKRKRGSSALRKGKISAASILLAILVTLLTGCLAKNAAPVASFIRSPASGPSPLSTFFDASSSYDPDGTILTHRWRFGDGFTGTGKTATHTYATPGSYEVRLTVTDDQGATGSTVRMITVLDPAKEIPVGTQIGNLAPEFTLKDLQGESVSLSDFRGEIVLLDFWASWCPPCRYSMPHLDELRERYRTEGLVVVAISLDQNMEDISAFLEENGYSDMVVLWESQKAAQAVKTLYGVSGIPHTFVIDRQGIIRYSDHPIRLRDRDIEPWL
jgi:thiol-disulfide isomerase/thioredoxin